MGDLLHSVVMVALLLLVLLVPVSLVVFRLVYGSSGRRPRRRVRLRIEREQVLVRVGDVVVAGRRK